MEIVYFVGGYLGGFYFLVILNNIATKFCVYAFVCTCLHFSVPRNGITGSDSGYI